MPLVEGWQPVFPDAPPRRWRHPAQEIVFASFVMGFPMLGTPSGILFPINEQATGRYQATLVGADGITPLPGSLLAGLTLTLYAIRQDDTEVIVNSRNKQNCLNTANVAISTSGVLTWTVQAGDTTLVDATLAFERHVALFEWTWVGGAGKQEVILVVRNLRRVT